MPLTLIATPIGHPEDITLRALSTLKGCEVLIGEEFKELTTLLKRHEIPKPDLRLLNEHSTDEDIEELFQLCKTKHVGLVSDAGTPNFCDPGAALIKKCRSQKIPIFSLPGPSSLMTLLSHTSIRLNEFVFRGFLPTKKEPREEELKRLRQEKRAIILMDTPYRLRRLCDEVAEYLPHRRALLGLNLSLESEVILEESGHQLIQKLPYEKAEFVLLIYPE